MENASKALIIAGAILISILLISVGVMVMNSADSVVGTAGDQMDQAAIESFNARFTQYAGTQRGSTIKSLMNTVNSVTAGGEHTIEIAGDVGTSPSAVQSSVKNSTIYKVQVDVGTDGLVNKITITKNGSASGSTPE